MDEEQAGCRECGRDPADQWLNGEGPLCDRCADDRISTVTGMPGLPDAPPPIVATGGDGQRHVLRYRFWRAPTGICVQLREEGVPAGEGFEFGVLGDHHADVATLMAAVRAEAETEIGRRYLQPSPDSTAGARWLLAEDEVAGRLEWDPEDDPVRVVVDGQAMSWRELGELLASYEGWRFRLLIDNPATDLRSTTHK